MQSQMKSQPQIVDALFNTTAFQVCAPTEPFWYTSGLFGPYYVNTHFLYGDATSARELLELIETAAKDQPTFPQVIGEAVAAQVAGNDTYREVISALVKLVPTDSYDFISGGERRDFFFSFAVAQATGKPHLSIFKDGSAVYTNLDGDTVNATAGLLAGKRALHVVDLVTQASSYLRTWLPTLETVGATISDTLAVVDRNQDGAGILAERGVRLHSLATVAEEFFALAATRKLITGDQLQMLREYTANPTGFVRNFVDANPEFLAAQIAAGGKTEERARRLLASEYLR